MGRRSGLPAVSQQLFLTCELEWLRKDEEEAVCVIVSLPGRDDTLVKSWRTLHGSLDSGQAEDLAAYVQRTVMDALLTFHGVQGSWPMG